MSTSPQLESYLATLDKSLGSISISDRAEIITEIKSHVLAAQDRDPSQKLESILAALGEPEQVASKYLLDRGLKTAKPAKRPIVKWLVVGFLGSMFLFLAFVTVLIFKFSPLVQVSKDQQRVTLLGGLIDVDGKGGTVRIGDIPVSGHGKVISGARHIDPAQTNQINIPFNNGTFEFSNSTDDTFSWDCSLATDKPETNLAVQKGKSIDFDLSESSGSKCEFKFPKNVSLKLVGNNMSAVIDRPFYNVDLKANNGKLSLTPDPSAHYQYDIKLLNGKMDSFESSEAKDAYHVSISMTNGKIRRD